MMLTAFPNMLHESSLSIIDFFNQNIYKPLLFEDSITVSWPGDLNEFVFDSNTSLITEQFLEQTLIG